MSVAAQLLCACALLMSLTIEELAERDCSSPPTFEIAWNNIPLVSEIKVDASVLLGLETVVGTPVRVYNNTLNVEKGMFVRICVEIDSTFSDVEKVSVNGHWYNMQYKGVPSGNDDVHEQRLIEMHQEVGKDNVENVAKESGEINAVHGDWLVV
ncbi:hypothetical protein KIW84_015836 [Lathyrus oleraceus]|uniref:Uncharacterized protein n=1 Tax=Pisum sativum TaxID=3888 RepID=A0A9D5H1E5_PEA|nr:hypothetical protein KIW84_015836 [Pisum sativum]